MASVTTCSHCFKIMIINCLKLIYETLMVFFGSCLFGVFFWVGGEEEGFFAIWGPAKSS